MTLTEQIMALYPTITLNSFIKEIVLQDDGMGPYIKEWNVVDLAQPTPDQLAAVVPPSPDMEAMVVNLVQQRLDSFAQTRSYDGILSACTYVTSKIVKFQSEGQYCVDARDSHWSTCYKILSDVLAGLRPVPSLDQVVTELPVLAWPV